jgi:hypothetical protein
MSDTVAQMETLKADTIELAKDKKHSLGPFKEFAGGAINIAICTGCQRWALAEIYPFGTDIRGSAVTMECGDRKVS